MYTRYADENGIWGKWTLALTTGDFHIWPKKSSTQGEEEEVRGAINVTQVVVAGSLDT